MFEELSQNITKQDMIEFKYELDIMILIRGNCVVEDCSYLLSEKCVCVCIYMSS
jgi:hypothetical protein